MKVFLYICSLLATVAYQPASSNDTLRTTSLRVEIQNLEKPCGEIEVILFKGKKRFLKKRASFRKQRIEVKDDKTFVVFEDLPFGTYAAVSYHDMNANKKFDRNMMGLPKEPYAFSKPFKKKFRKPYFKEVSFEVSDTQNQILLALQRY